MKTEERIKNDADKHASEEPHEVQAGISFYTGAISERNKAIDECIQVYKMCKIKFYVHGISASTEEMTNALEKLKV